MLIRRTLVMVLASVVGCGSPQDESASPPDSSDAAVDAEASVEASPEVAEADVGDTLDAPSARFSLHVAGNTLVDGAGTPLRLLGVNHSGTEYACIQGFAIFDGPADDALAASIATWKANAVRVPLNEDCWLDLNGVKPEYGGATYRAAIQAWVAKLHAHGLHAILELHWNAPGTFPAKDQQPMPDLDHSPEFWKSVATTFIDDPAVVFDLYNEPYVDKSNSTASDPWACWRDGCTITVSRGGVSGSWKAAGMQLLVDTVRATGAKQPIMLGGLAYSNDLSGWLANMAKDPLSALVASYHLYNFNTCKTATCWNAVLDPVSKKVPLVTGELGEDDCKHDFVDGYMDWADAHGASYLGWTWNLWGSPTSTSCGSSKIILVADWGGTPTPYGFGLKDRLSRLP